MSKAYGVFDYGLVIREDVAAKIREKHHDEDFLDDSDVFARYDQFDGSFLKIHRDGSANALYDHLSDETFYLVPMKKIFSFCEKMYPSVEQIVDEIKESVGDDLPEDFSIQDNLFVIFGTIWG